jgi:hypothetical protein
MLKKEDFCVYVDMWLKLGTSNWTLLVGHNFRLFSFLVVERQCDVCRAHCPQTLGEMSVRDYRNDWEEEEEKKKNWPDVSCTSAIFSTTNVKWIALTLYSGACSEKLTATSWTMAHLRHRTLGQPVTCHAKQCQFLVVNIICKSWYSIWYYMHTVRRCVRLARRWQHFICMRSGGHTGSETYLHKHNRSVSYSF